MAPRTNPIRNAPAAPHRCGRHFAQTRHDFMESAHRQFRANYNRSAHWGFLTARSIRAMDHLRRPQWRNEMRLRPTRSNIFLWWASTSGQTERMHISEKEH